MFQKKESQKVWNDLRVNVRNFLMFFLVSSSLSYLDELERETEDPEGLCRLRPRGGEPMRPGLLLGDLDLRQGSFHSSGLLGSGTISFLVGGSNGPLKTIAEKVDLDRIHL